MVPIDDKKYEEIISKERTNRSNGASSHSKQTQDKYEVVVDKDGKQVLKKTVTKTVIRERRTDSGKIEQYEVISEDRDN